MTQESSKLEVTLATQTQVHSVGHSASDTAFKEGRTKTGGRAKGTPNKIGGDLRQMIMNAAVAPASSISLKMASALPLAMRTRTPTGQRPTGPPVPTGSLLGHSGPYRSDTAVPIVFWWQGMKGQTRILPVDTTMIAPTLANIIDVRPPTDLDGTCFDLGFPGAPKCSR
jgi:hypothetical protein